LGFASLAVAEICDALLATPLAEAEQSRAVAVGFDSGDFIVLGTLESGKQLFSKVT
jgi:hypothetical protein